MKYLIFGKPGKNYPTDRLYNVATNETEMQSIIDSLNDVGITTKIVTEKEYFKNCNDFEEQLYRTLDALGGFSEILDHGAVLVSISIRGDWKHEHLHCDHILSKLFDMRHINDITTESDGSDYYTSTHYYIREKAS